MSESFREIHMNKKIPTFVINLKKRHDRRSFSEKEFKNRLSFSVNVIEAVENEIPAVGLYLSLCKVIRIAKKQHYPYVLFCEDDHQFTKFFDCDQFRKQINIVERKEANILSGGVSWFDYGIKVTPNLYWINSFTGMQFTVIFARFYDIILNSPFGQDNIIDRWLSALSQKNYVISPFISVQKDFGYSDVTIKNNEKGVVKTYFINMSNKLKMLDTVKNHLSALELQEIPEEDCKDIEISVYIILRRDRYRRSNIVEQFQNKTEFNVKIIEAFEDDGGSLNLWLSVKNIVSIAKENNDEVIIICEDDHFFTNYYSKHILFRNIFTGAYLGADIILGGISCVDQAIVVDKYLCWINEFYSNQFVIIYDRFYDIILDEPSMINNTISGKFSEITTNKYVIHPFISVKKDFVYSDAQSIRKAVDPECRFNICSEKLNTIRLISGDSEFNKSAL